MKKNISIICVLIFTLLSLTACGKASAGQDVYASSETLETETSETETSEAAQTEEETKNGFSVVTTIFPEYDWVKSVLGENPGNAEVTLLLDNGVDLHNYQPTTEDVLKIASCDLFIYVGGESDGWVEDALKEATNKDMKVINLLDTLGDRVKEEEIVEGMEAEEEEEEGEGEEGPEYDEHVWLSLNNAKVLTGAIKDALSEIDPENAQVYDENEKAYASELDALENEYEQVTSSSATKTLLFGDRFPFRYLTDDYDLDYYAAFVGCSAETEASFETVVFLANKVDELSLKSIMTIDASDKKIAETIRDNTADKDQEILTLDSMQSTTSQDIEGGATYLSIMKENLEVLKKALG